MTTTATMVYEAHQHGFRVTVRAGRNQLVHQYGLTAEDAVALATAHGVTAANVTVLPAQA